MAVIDVNALAEASVVVARVAGQQIRQAATTAVTSAVSSAIASSSASPTPSSSSTSSSAIPTTTGGPINGNPNGTTDGNQNTGQNNGSGGQSSPLLFFVALGFGVVFTNLWIIVGVKYCFRYNARNRQLRGEDGQPINLDQLPPHPRRRRREKKLMPIEEVNEKFPMIKYKTWVMTRAQEGLPTQGGVSVPPSRAQSLREAEGISSKVSETKEREAISARPGTSATIRKDDHDLKDDELANKLTTEQTNATAATVDTEAPTRTSQEHEDEEDEDHIQSAMPADICHGSGDTCAICIDTLEDDDDVRGLTCGHAFHASCIDPWLTSRRASCPLCKADYYTPKPRAPAAAEAGDASMGGHQPTLANANGVNMPARPNFTWVGFRGGRMTAPLRFTAAQPSPMLDSRGQMIRPQQQTTQTQAAPVPQRPTRWYSFRPNVPPVRMPRFGRRRNEQSAIGPAEPTPATLEEGNIVRAI